MKKLEKDKTRILLSLNTAQYLEGIDLAFSNSKRLYLASEILGFFGLLGPANSLAILSAEEGLKGFLLACQLLSYPPGVTSLHKVFGSHSAKHEAGWWFGFFEDVKELSGFNDFEGQSKLSSAERSDMARKFYAANIKLMEERLKSSERDWWKSANQKKQVGLYVDLNGKPWSSPNLITRKDLKRSLREAIRVLGMTRMYIKLFKRLKNSGELEEFIKDSRAMVDKLNKLIETKKGE